MLNGRGAIRFTGGHGDVKNMLSGENLPNSDIGAARGSLRWFAGDRTTVTVSGFYERNQQDTFNYILRGGPNYPAAMLDEPLGFKRKLAIGSVEVKQEFDNFDLICTFGIQDIRARMTSDNTDGLVYSQLTGLPPSFFSSRTCSDCTRYDFNERAYSGEVRATSKPEAPVRWITGVSIYNSSFEQGGTNTSSRSGRPRTAYIMRSWI
ncbi:hypothetical protein [Bradyrhizobium sp. 2S1]|uniref:hypothetical protein n=1 Tax=Bradyrhizobium sp. 2S1 TaxID=1404429 RepID=UPI0014093BAB|nr:hypothetical protein [Bradyrhizobium sp. 2S1]MCK7673405.1 hypothetical protein [Bradyrhizobium sp. 2S1]